MPCLLHVQDISGKEVATFNEAEVHLMAGATGGLVKTLKLHGHPTTDWASGLKQSICEKEPGRAILPRNSFKKGPRVDYGI